MKKVLFGFTILGFVLCILLPIFGRFKDYVTNAATILSGLCGLGTLVIAILLYDKYGVEKKIVDKNLEVVLQFVEELRKTTLCIKGESESGSYALMVNLLDRAIEKGEFMSRYLDDKLFFNLNYGYALSNLYEISNNPFMPSEISDCFKKIMLGVLPEITEEDKKGGYAVVTGSTVMLEDNDSIIGKLNGQNYTLGEFINIYMSVVEAIKHWLKSHNVDDKCLNF